MSRKLTNDDRREWIDNDEGLYDWWRSSRQKKKQFIKENKAEIDEAILNVLESRRRPHYLKYG